MFAFLAGHDAFLFIWRALSFRFSISRNTEGRNAFDF